ncbi:AMP-binding protein [Nocardiopsis sp. L17-MgMaSL7]|uniref:AMP-binding protein n=1 Tax=Nocardiopsis sp. L17-MgMaSL7 TaxID=1938893 RepID=UPI000D70A580|nr:O-succinylbenzoic acid--CoA ligase [Nocardiopsis sp. L17-MgMaSL7]
MAQASEPRSQVPGREGERALQAVRGLTPAVMHERLARALDGTGPALLPIPDGTPDPRAEALVAAMRPSSLCTPDGTTELPGGVAVGPDAALVVTTSGSTGEPKGVELSASALRASARASVARIGAAPGDRWLCVLPAGHISGIQVMIRALVTGGEVVHAPFDTDTVAELARELRPHVSLVPTQLRRLMAAGADLSVFGTILLGGAAAEPSLLDAARAAGGRVVTTYGMSETCGGCVYDGVALDGTEVRIAGAEPGEPGRVVLGGPTLLTGYRLPPGSESRGWARGGDDAGMVRDDAGRLWLRTNDLGRVDAEGRLHVLGRMDEVVNTGGHKVVPGQVNAILAARPEIAESVVVGRPDPEWGERVTAVVVPADPGNPPALEELRGWVRERLPAYACPRELDVRAALPMLASGKPDLVTLRRPGS